MDFLKIDLVLHSLGICLLAHNTDKMHDHLGPCPRDVPLSQSHGGTRCRADGGGTLAGDGSLGPCGGTWAANMCSEGQVGGSDPYILILFII